MTIADFLDKHFEEIIGGIAFILILYGLFIKSQD